MEIQDHLTKAGRFERTVAKLDAERDAECVIEACMLAATHCINAALHKMGLTDPMGDILHSSMSVIPRDLGPDMNAALAALSFIEGLRPFYVRGDETPTVSIGKAAIESMQTARARCQRVLAG